MGLFQSLILSHLCFCLELVFFRLHNRCLRLCMHCVASSFLLLSVANFGLYMM